MIIHNLQQGSPEWHEFRAAHYPASEAASALGIKGAFKSRNAYLHERATGERQAVSKQLQAKFDQGHLTEGMARPLAEKIIGEDLYPAVGTNADHPKLSASFDGISMGGEVIWEHKLWNESLAAGVLVGEIPEKYNVQMQQQLMISGAERCLFMVSDGTEERCVHGWVYPDPGLQQQIVEGWAKFEEDLAAYKADPSDEWVMLEEELAFLMDEIGPKQERADWISGRLKELAGGKSKQGEKFKVVFTERKGSINYAKAANELGLADQYDFEKYRSQPSTVASLKRINQ